MFALDELAWVSFGAPIRRFRFDNQVSNRPRLVGPVVASLTLNRERHANLCIYPVSRELYSDEAQNDMLARLLPSFRDWLRAKRALPVTAILGHEEILAEWTGQVHRFHELRFL